jgi:hypothetical protein
VVEVIPAEQDGRSSETNAATTLPHSMQRSMKHEVASISSTIPTSLPALRSETRAMLARPRPRARTTWWAQLRFLPV